MFNLLKRLKMRERIDDRMKNKSIKNAHEKHLKCFSGEYEEISKIIENFRSGGGLKHEFQLYKLWELQKYLSKYKPKKILELGSGSSTFIFSKYSASSNNQKINVTSYDESSHWIENTKCLISDYLHDGITLKQADRSLGFDGEFTTVSYETDIEGPYDFVLIDGPSQKINGMRRKDSVNTDVLSVVPAPEVILVDGRESTFAYLADKLKGRYEAFPSDLKTKDRVDVGYRYFSFLRKSNAI